MKIGYARTSAVERNLDLQVRALQEVGAELIFTDHGISANAVIKPGWLEACSTACPDDEIVVWRFDRISHSVRDLIHELDRLRHHGINFLSIYDKIETRTADGQFFFDIVGEFARFDRDVKGDLIAERLAAARSAGKRLGRPRVGAEAQWQELRRLMSAVPPMTLAQAARLLGISRQAVHSRIKREREAAARG